MRNNASGIYLEFSEKTLRAKEPLDLFQLATPLRTSDEARMRGGAR